MLLASLLLIILQGASHYADLNQDEIEAEKLMSCELKIMELNILSELHEAELVMDGMETNIKQHLHMPDKLFSDAHSALMESDIIKAIAVGFKPNYFPSRGYWFEPRCVRVGDQLITEQIGGPDHDYFNMEWYKIGLTNTRGPIRWTNPYFDSSQNNVPLMSLAWPIVDHDTIVAVLCMDVTLMSLKKMLEYAKPYKGSVCQLLDENGKLLVSSDRIELDSSKYLIGVKNMAGHGLRVKLACPKSAIYGHSRVKNTIKLVIIMSALLLIAYITRRSIYNIISLNAAEQKQHDVKNEMRIAHNIQMSILRRDFPDNLSATLLPMQEVGGDLYDFYQRDDVLYFIIGDVSGKGVPAAMMMSSTVNLFRMAAQHYSTPVKIVSQINSVLSERNPSMMFVTAFVGKLDMKHGLLTYCNAGHNPPILNGELLNTDPDIPIGYDAGFEFHQRGALFPEGSRIVLYTDGITEIRNTDQQFMGTKRLLNIVREHRGEVTQELEKHILEQTEQFALSGDGDIPPSGEAQRHDDLTLMCIANNMAAETPALVIRNDVDELTRVKALVSEYCQSLNCDRRQTRKIMLAIEEAVANVINYAYPKGAQGLIEIDITAMQATTAQTGDITIVISDNGQPFNPLDYHGKDVDQVIDDRQIGGLGIHLYQQIMDSVIYNRKDNKNILTLSKNITINGN